MKNRTTLEQDMYCMFPTGLTQLQILELVDYILAEADVAFSEGYTLGFEAGYHTKAF